MLTHGGEKAQAGPVAGAGIGAILEPTDDAGVRTMQQFMRPWRVRARDPVLLGRRIIRGEIQMGEASSGIALNSRHSLGESVLWLTIGLVLAAFASVAHSTDEEPVVQTTRSSKALGALPPKPLEQRVAVTVYEFHSGVPDVSVGAATDIFTTALIESRQFRVVERHRLAQGVLLEKQLNGAGQATGDAAQHQLRGARYIFEGTVSEANAGAAQHQGGVSIGGLNLGGAKNKDTLAVDVRILDAQTGDVLDSVSVSKVLNDSSIGVSGTAALANTLASMSGRSASPLTPDVNLQSSHKESVDKALRSCIETSVLALVKRVDLSADAIPAP